MTLIKRGLRVEWRSMGDRRPFVWFHGTVIELPTVGKWIGVALIDEDGEGRKPRHVTLTRLVISADQRKPLPPLVIPGGACA